MEYKLKRLKKHDWTTCERTAIDKYNKNHLLKTFNQGNTYHKETWRKVRITLKIFGVLIHNFKKPLIVVNI